ncbi:hypothetical protein D3C85_1405380 [compost metagenome]
MDNRPLGFPLVQDRQQDPIADVLEYHQLGQLDDSASFKRHTPQGDHVVGHQPGCVADGRLHAAGAFHVPQVLASAGPHVQARITCQVGQRASRAEAFDEPGARHQFLGAAGQRLHRQATVLEGREAHP